jgi:hypothetical protein
MSDSEAIPQTGQHDADHAVVAIATAALTERGHAIGRCPNCDAGMIAAYCAVCGQERDTHRRSVWGLLSDLVEDIISFDSRILRTGIALMAEPGELAAAFREGRPHRYVPALRLYFFVSLIFFVILSASGLAIMQFQIVATPEKIIHNANGYFVANPNPQPDADDLKLMPISKKKAEEPGTKFAFSEQTHFFSPVGAYHSDLPPEARAKLLTFSQDGQPHTKAAQGSWIEKKIYGTVDRLAADPAALNEPLTAWLPRVLFALLPLFALLLMLFYFRKRKDFYFVDHLIFSLNMHSFVFIVLIVAVGVAQVLDASWVALGAVVAMGLYFLFAMKRFYGQSWFWTGLKFLTIGFIYCFFFLMPAMLAVVAASIFWA